MNIYRFSWCTCSFDQEVHIEASSKKLAKRIFSNKVGEINDYTSIINLSKIYKRKALREMKLKIHFKEIV